MNKPSTYDKWIKTGTAKTTLEKFFAELPPDIGSMARRREISEALLEVVVQTETEFETRVAALEKERLDLIAGIEVGAVEVDRLKARAALLMQQLDAFTRKAD
jgi:hypothetical protein